MATILVFYCLCMQVMHGSTVCNLFSLLTKIVSGIYVMYILIKVFLVFSPLIDRAGQSEWKLFSVSKYPERRSKERLSLRKSVEKERQGEENVYVEQRMQDEARKYELQQRVQQAEAIADELQRKLDEVEEREWERLAAQEQATAAEPIGLECRKSMIQV